MTSPSPTIFSLDLNAVAAGGAKAGEYLDSIGKTDLAALNAAQWDRFCQTLVYHAWVAALDKHVVALEAADGAPF